MGASRQLDHARVLRVHHREVTLSLIEKDAGLGRGIFGKAGVSIQVIRGQVQDRGAMEPKLVDSLQLEARELDAIGVIGFDLDGCLRERPAEVASDEDPLSRLRQKLAGEHGGGALSVRPGDPDQRGGPEKPRCQLHLRPNRDSGGGGAPDFGKPQGNARAHHDQVGAVEQIAGTPAQDELHPLCTQRGQGLAQLGLRSSVDRGDPGAGADEEANGGDSALAEPVDDDPLALEQSFHLLTAA